MNKSIYIFILVTLLLMCNTTSAGYWYSDTASVVGITGVDSGSAPSIFYKDGQWQLIIGARPLNFIYGFEWNGTQWISDSSVDGGLVSGYIYNIPITPETKVETGENIQNSSPAEVDLNILNVKSYPIVGNNWTVGFNTIGVANLTIMAPVDSTMSWVDTVIEGEDNADGSDLEFLGLMCGTQLLEYTWTDDDAVFIENYACDETSYEVSRVLTPGKHVLEFRFDLDVVKYAYNTAGWEICDEGDNQTTCTVTTSHTINNNSVLVFNNLIIESGGNLIAGAGQFFTINAANDITIQSGGSITGNANITAINLTIDSGGVININQKGYTSQNG
ncbi:MAG: hypothetical protein KAR23_01655, partial [Candidatus Aenigmarchaeota archaeon]|nr:hypothetical protein [Candidatus Aenigmarchaeota archaeon]